MGAIVRLDTRHARAYVAEPDGAVRAHVLVVHDAYGLLPHVRFLCDELAGDGFVAIAPDLLQGTSTRSDAEASRLLEQLDVDHVDRVLDATLHAVATLGHPARPLAVIGFSVGAEVTAAFAVRIAAAAYVTYYGVPPTEQWSELAMPVLAHWADRDDWDDESSPRAFLSALERIAPAVTSHRYDDAPHGFANSDLDAFRLGPAELAWQRTREFLRRELRERSTTSADRP